MGAQEKNSTRPGVMLYFDMVEPILSLRDSEKGRILMAIVAYAREGTEPAFTGRLALAWGFIQPKLDRDAEVYENTVLKKKYAAFCKKRNALKLPKISYQQWLKLTPEERKQMLTPDNGCVHVDTPDNTCYPTGKGKRNGKGKREGDGKGDGDGKGEGDGEGKETRKETGNGKEAASVSSAAEDTEVSPAAAAAEKKNLKKLHGELGQGVVNLTDYQMERLLDQLGLDMFDYYVKKLSDFILENGASVKNHYATILRWWMEDTAV